MTTTAAEIRKVYSTQLVDLHGAANLVSVALDSCQAALSLS
jgi:hypothetical protein